MKKLSLKNATSMLSRKEMKAVMGGYGGGAPSCVDNGTVCYTDGSTIYRCSFGYDAEGYIECCCGHDAGDDVCSKG
jgi:natural product precursor